MYTYYIVPCNEVAVILTRRDTDSRHSEVIPSNVQQQQQQQQ